MDAGGLKKEWFLLLVRELFDPKYGMWVWDEETNLCWFNPASLESEEQYTLIGVRHFSCINQNSLSLELTPWFAQKKNRW